MRTPVAEDRIRDNIAELNRTSTQRITAAQLHGRVLRELLLCP
jgi:hypothetical protein